MSANNEIRLAQLIQAFGPGALVDLPDKSVMIKGLGGWPLKSGNREMRRIEEPRLVNYLTSLLRMGTDGISWLEDGVTLSLYEPPLKDSSPVNFGKSAVPAVIYPRWQIIVDPDDPSRQRLERYTSGEKAKSKKGVVRTPVRWLAACKKGHIDDVNWRNFAHRGRTDCQQTMFFRDEGTGGDPQFTWIACECGQAARRLSELYTQGAPLGYCDGRRPWLDKYETFRCGEPLVAMTRGAINNYYPQILRLIALPQQADAVQLLVEAFLSNFDEVQSEVQATGPVKFGDHKIKQAFKGLGGAEIWRALQAVRARSSVHAPSLKAENPKVEEFDVLSSGGRVIGSEKLGSRLFAETLNDAEWRIDNLQRTNFISALVKVHRLCEVSSLYGFTRIEPARSPFDDTLEEITLEVEGQPLDDKIRWLPAMEQFGEGLFLKLDCSLIRARCKEISPANDALSQLEIRYNEWAAKEANRRPFPGREYVFAHSLAHMLIEQISLDAGYPSTSLVERIYALSSDHSAEVHKLGILIYAAGGGSQGTLGGLIQQAPRIPALIRNGLDRINVCGNDPICGSQSHILTGDDGLINGAACHGCLFVAETSCEKRNMLLDRRSLIAVATAPL